MALNHEQAQEYISMGINLMKQEKYPEAKQLFLKALEEEKSNYEGYMHLGNACVNLGELEAAVDAFNNALNAKENSGEAYFSLGNVHFLRNDYRRAIKAYNKAEAVGYIPAEMYLIMAQIFSESNDTEQTLRCLNRALQSEPMRGEIWRKKISILTQTGKLDLAEEALEEFLELLPDALDGYELQAKLYCGQERYDLAKEKIAIAAKRFPTDPRIMMTQLSVYAQADDVENTKAMIAKLKGSEFADDYRKIIAIYEAQMLIDSGDTEGAIASLEWALEVTKNDSDLLYTELSIFIAKLQYDKIIAVADKIIAIKDISPAVLASAKFYRAMAMKEIGMIDAAMLEFKKVSRELRKITIDNPSLTEVYMLRLLCHCQLNEFNQAFALADYLQNIAPDTADGHAYRHLIYKQMGDEEKSQQELEAARRLNPDIQS